MSLVLQRSSNRNLVLSANQQANYGEVLADANLTQRQRIDSSSGFTPKPSNRTDKGMVGKGTEFATNDQITAWDTDGTIKSVCDTWLLGWALAFLFGQDTVVGAGPYTHNFSIPQISATMPCTCVYVEETNDVKRKFQDMSIKSVAIEIPERGDISLTIEMVGTGRWTEVAMAAGPPALTTVSYLLASDVQVAITPAAGAQEIFIGRQKGISIKVDRGTAPFQSSGDGLCAGSNQCGMTKFSVDLTLAANSVDDVNGWFEQGTRLAILIQTNQSLTQQFCFSYPSVRVKANKLGVANDIVTWALSWDETTSLQVGAVNAISAFVINQVAAYLIPA